MIHNTKIEKICRAIIAKLLDEKSVHTITDIDLTNGFSDWLDAKEQEGVDIKLYLDAEMAIDEELEMQMSELQATALNVKVVK